MNATDLIEKIRAALDEDERVATEACDRDSGEWFDGDDCNVWRAEELYPHDDVEQHQLVAYGMVKGQPEHMARHDPARVLRQVAAMRKILELHQPVKVMNNDGVRVIGYECRVCFDNHDGINNLSNMQDWPCRTLLAFAEALGVQP
jgi:hypothetical protein